MHRFSFKKGITFICANKHWQLIRRLVTGKLQFESEDGEIKNLTEKEILERWQSGQWVIDEATLKEDSDVIYLVTPADLSIYPKKWQQIAKRRLHYLQVVDPENNKYDIKVWEVSIHKAGLSIADPKPPCPASVHNWWRKYRITKSINSLLPKTPRFNGQKTDLRYEIFEDVVKTVYLNSNKLPVLDVYKKVQQRITVRNLGLDDANKIKQVARSTIYIWVNNLRSDIVDSSRLGASVARNKYRTVMGGLKVQAVLERYEIDHTPLDLIVLDSTTQLPLGRGWLTLSIDKFSRMVTGFYISFNAPSSYSVLQCLKQSILPKEGLLERFPDIKNEWPVFGIPNLLALDNGMDLHSHALKQACLELGVQILYCPAGSPEMKGSVERFFRTMNMGLIHKIPGTTFSNIGERGDYPSEDKACVDLETLVHLVTKWVVDVYNMTPHRGINDTPLARWRESANKSIIELPVYPTALDVITGVPATRTAFHYGVELEGLHYNNKQLQEVRKISGENMKVELKFYEDQVAYVDIFDPYQKVYLRVDCVQDEYVQNLHRESHRLSRVHARKKFGEQYSLPQLMESRIQIEEIIKDALKAKKMGARKFAANQLLHDSTAVYQSKNPIKERLISTKKTVERPPEQLDSGLDDDLPNISDDRRGDQP